MRTVVTLLSLTALSSLSACGGEKCADGSNPVNEECPCSDGTYPADNGGSCDVALDCDVGEIESNGVCRFECPDGTLASDEDACPVNLNPAAVGFEFDGVWDGAELRGPNYTDDAGDVQELLPLVLVTFADEAYFSSTDADDQEQFHSCEFYATFSAVAGTSELAIDGSDTVWTQFDTTLSMLDGQWDFDSESCATKLNPALWGDDGVDLQSSFINIHFGIGFGPMTDYLAEAWQDDDGEWASDAIADIAPAFFAMHIAINDDAGTFELFDWTTAYAFEWDDVTGEPELNEDETEYVQHDMTSETSLPPVYIRSSAYWYQDFPLLDLSNLGDGRPTAAPPAR